ncbi:MAG TPA: GH3 auxin-responsive promoter family protein, partial [Agitococcus sp.]|nr:GH3 auxin-responsive promoter family protein [Agitococcus sp.]HNE92456.1 GH3 auxin-responsive promoter family protein [Agitococcus sp.]
GEKMSPDAARQALATVAQQYGLEPISLLAVQGFQQLKPRYVALFSDSQLLVNQQLRQNVAQAVDQELRGHFHYELARDLRQLDSVVAVVAQDGWRVCQDIAIAGGMIEGNIKPEPVRRVQRAAVERLLPSAQLVLDQQWDKAS